MTTDPPIRGPIDPHAIFVIRWVAVAGQLAALFFTHSILKFELPLLPAMVVIGSSAIVNLCHIHAARRRRLYHQHHPRHVPESRHLVLHLNPRQFHLYHYHLHFHHTSFYLHQYHVGTYVR